MYKLIVFVIIIGAACKTRSLLMAMLAHPFITILVFVLIWFIVDYLESKDNSQESDK